MFFLSVLKVVFDWNKEVLTWRSILALLGKVFAKVLEHAGVFKRTPEGRAAFLRFIDAVNNEG